VSNRKNVGFDRLLEQAATQAVETAADIHEQAVGNSDVQKLMFSALALVAKIGQHEHAQVEFLEPESSPPPGLEATTTLYISQQASVDSNDFDFAVYAYDHKGRYLSAPGWRRVIVECVSERLANKPPEDFRERARLRVLRLELADIVSDPWGQAELVFDWASASFGY
jgi:hypothetical protein